MGRRKCHFSEAGGQGSKCLKKHQNNCYFSFVTVLSVYSVVVNLDASFINFVVLARHLAGNAVQMLYSAALSETLNAQELIFRSKTQNHRNLEASPLWLSHEDIYACRAGSPREVFCVALWWVFLIKKSSAAHAQLQKYVKGEW